MEQVLTATFIFVTGLCFGSFANVIIYRLPRKQSIARPPSSCPFCGKRLGFWELVPLLGYLLIRGRCRGCRAGVSVRYPAVELLTGSIFVLVYTRFSLALDFFVYATLLFLLLVIAVIDLEHRIVPNSLVAAGLIAGVIYFTPGILNYFTAVHPLLLSSQNPVDALSGFLLGTTIMLVIFLVSRGGMGAGDIKLMALIGLFVGLRGTALVLMIGFLLGAITGIFFLVTGKLSRKDALPFAPFLALGALVQVMAGEQIWEWYTNIF